LTFLSTQGLKKISPKNKPSDHTNFKIQKGFLPTAAFTDLRMSSSSTATAVPDASVITSRLKQNLVKTGEMFLADFTLPTPLDTKR